MGQFRKVCRVLALFVLCLPFGQAHLASAQTDGVFTVSDIEVDVTAGDAVSARQQAHLEGQRRGLERLLRRLVPAEEHGRLPPVAGLPVEQYVQNFEIGNERVSSTQYVAELTVAYSPDAVRDLLRSERLPFAETPSAPLLVLPVYDGPDGTRLWPDDNPWWQAWAENLDDERLLRLVLPLGDLQDMGQVSVEEAEVGDPEALLPLAERYGSEDVLVVTARVPAVEAGQAPVVRLEAQRIGRVERIGEPLTLQGDPGESQEELLAEAVRRFQDSLDERWKRDNLLRVDQAGLMVADIPISALADWVTVNRGLNDLPEVDAVEIATFARDNVRVRIRYIGDEVRLEDAFRRLGLTLSREGETWQLLPTGGSPSPDGPPSARSASSLPGPR